MNKLTIIVLILLTGCSGYRPSDKNSVKSFDEKYSAVINSLKDSLVKNVGKDTSYYLERRRSIEEIEFSYKGGGYFKPPFKLNNNQAQFLIDVAVGNIFYEKSLDAFACKLFYFKNLNKTIWLVIAPNKSSTDSMGGFDKLVYFNGDRFYFLGDAWP